MNPGGKKKSVPTNTTNNKHLNPFADIIYREFWRSLPSARLEINGG